MKFGILKIKMLKTLTESFSEKKKTEVKTIINRLKSSREFKELYLLYEDVENKFFVDTETAKNYVEELSMRLKNIHDKKTELGKFLSSVNEEFKNVEVIENNVYNILDTFCEPDSLLNIDKKITAKKELVNHLISKKQISEQHSDTLVKNENLLYAVLTNNFNVLYDHTLNEEEKKELKGILSLSNEDVENKMEELKESILTKISTLTESSDSNDELIEKLNKTKNEVNSMFVSKYNYYKLKQLKGSL